MDVDESWSKCYAAGRDFRMIPASSISSFLTGSTTTNKRCLDIGCGTGHLTRELYHRGFHVIGIDASRKAIEIAQSLTMVSGEQLKYIHFDIEHDDLDALPWQPYGLITCKLVYAFIKDKQSFLRRVGQMLEREGLFVIITPIPTQVPPEKINIAVNFSHTLAELRTYFQKVNSYDRDGLTYFICHK